MLIGKEFPKNCEHAAQEVTLHHTANNQPCACRQGWFFPSVVRGWPQASLDTVPNSLIVVI